MDSLKYWITKFNKEQALKQSDLRPTGFIPVKVENTAEQTYQEIEFPNGGNISLWPRSFDRHN